MMSCSDREACRRGTAGSHLARTVSPCVCRAERSGERRLTIAPGWRVGCVLHGGCTRVGLLFTSRLALVYLLFTSCLSVLFPTFPAAASPLVPSRRITDAGTAAQVTSLRASLTFHSVGRARRLELPCGGERQAALAFEELAQAAVAGAEMAANNSGSDLFARLAPSAATAQPIFPANWPIDRNRRGF